MTLTGAHETLNHVVLGVEALAGAVGNSTFPDLPGNGTMTFYLKACLMFKALIHFLASGIS
jgi:hypothetical protein